MIMSRFTDNNNTWLFGARDGNAYADNSRYFFEWLICNKEETVYWVTKNKKVFNVLRSEGKPVLYFYDLRNFLIFAKAKYIVCTHSYTGNDVFKFVSTNKKLITLWHGIPLKVMKKGNRDKKSRLKKTFFSMLGNKLQPDLFLVTSTKDISVFSDAFEINEDRFFIGSYPRVNDLLKNSKSKKAILYAPTFRDLQSQSYYDTYIFPTEKELSRLNDVLVSLDYVFKIKLHPYTSAIFPDVSEFSNIQIMPKNSDVQELLYEAEVLITDYSSIYFDFLVLKRNLIFFIPDFEWYHNKINRGLLYEYDAVTPGQKVTTWECLVNHLVQCVQYGDDFSLERNKLLKDFFNNMTSGNNDLYCECKRCN